MLLSETLDILSRYNFDRLECVCDRIQSAQQIKTTVETNLDHFFFYFQPNNCAFSSFSLMLDNVFFLLLLSNANSC